MKRIVYIDDDMFMRDLMEEVLNTKGYRAIGVRGDVQLYREFLNNGADILIIDIHLDGMDGIELGERFRACGLEEPIVFYSADETEQTRNRVQRIPNSYFAYKGNGVADILSVLERV